MSGRTGMMFVAAVALAAAPLARADDTRGAKGTQASQDARATQGTEGTRGTEATQGAEAAQGSTGSASEARGTAERSGRDVPTPKTGVATTEAGKADRVARDKGNAGLIRSLYAQNALDLETAKLAKERSQDEQVKQFADSLAREHERLGEKLEQLASGRGFTLAREEALRGGRKAHIDEMRAMSASDFDQHFREMMVADHEKLLTQIGDGLEQARASGDRELAAVLEEAKPTIEQHQQMAGTLGSAAGGSMGAGGAEAADQPVEGQARPQPADPSQGQPTGGQPTMDPGQDRPAGGSAPVQPQR